VINEAIRARIWELLRRSASSQRILQILQKEGTPISDCTLYSIRKEYAIQLRVDDPAQRQLRRDKLATTILPTEFGVGDIEGYGRKALHTHLRSIGLFYPR
jgi:hypothetical protein